MLTFKLYGNIAADPRLRQVGETGREVLDLRVASNPPGSDRTDFFNVTIWSDKETGELPREVFNWAKGHRVELSGQATSSTWNDTDGNRRESVTFHPNKYRNVTLDPHDPTGNLHAVDNTHTRTAEASAA